MHPWDGAFSSSQIHLYTTINGMKGSVSWEGHWILGWGVSFTAKFVTVELNSYSELSSKCNCIMPLQSWPLSAESHHKSDPLEATNWSCQNPTVASAPADQVGPYTMVRVYRKRTLNDFSASPLTSLLVLGPRTRPTTMRSVVKFCPMLQCLQWSKIRVFQTVGPGPIRDYKINLIDFNHYFKKLE